MTDRELRRWMEEQAAYNEAFRGKNIDPDKLRRLNKLTTLAEKLREADGVIVVPFSPFTNHSQNAQVCVNLPDFWMIEDYPQRALLADMLRLTDDFSVSALGPEGLTMAFGVRDMWEEFTHEGYDEDEENS